MRNSGRQKTRPDAAPGHSPETARPVYTRSGDGGETGLLGGRRVTKSDPRIDAGGALDELSAWLGVSRAHARAPGSAALLRAVQGDLVRLGSRIASPGPVVPPFLSRGRIRSFERVIDRLQGRLPPLRTFIHAGDSPSSAFLHVARAVCRRAERAVVALGLATRPEPECLRYLNRLSDLLFLLARVEDPASRRNRTVPVRSAASRSLPGTDGPSKPFADA